MPAANSPQTTLLPRTGRRNTLPKPAHMAPHPELRDESNPVILGRYRIIESRAMGGFGTVEVCWDTRLQRRVAIKCIPLFSQAGSMASSTVGEALAEARTSCMLQHPNIITVHDFEADDSYAYLVMEYVDGVTLSELMQRVEGGVLTGDECAYVVEALGDALAFAHENFVLHLDIKPANIMIDRSGTVKLGDFGMAALASAAGYADARGGTVGYMPPEQIEGDLVDERCDLFAMAVVSLMALTGVNPFSAKSAEASLALIEKGGAGRKTVERLTKQLSSSAHEAFISALEPDPAYRLSSVKDFANSLVPALGDPQEGLLSLQHLLGQVSNDDLRDVVIHGKRLSIVERAPWLSGALVRLLGGVVCGWLGYNIAPYLGLMDPTRRLIPMAIAALSGILFAPLGSALCIVGMVGALVLGALSSNAEVPASTTVFGIPGQNAVNAVGEIAGESGADVATEVLSIGSSGIVPAIQPHIALGISVICAIVLGVWWIKIARKHTLSAPALLMGAATLIPYAGIPIASLGMNPVGAGITTYLAWFIWRIARQATIMGISAQTVWVAITQLIARPSLLIEAAGFGLAALISSALSHRNSRSLAYLGAAVGFGMVILSSMIVGRVENGGVWVAPTGQFVAVALLLFMLMSIVVGVFGAPEDWGDDS